MSDRDFHKDRLIDMLLDEVVGGEVPPDLRERTLKKLVKQKPSRLFRIYIPAAAALFFIIASVVLHFSTGYFEYSDPEPQTVITAPERQVRISLKGYCKIIAEPESVVEIEAEDIQPGVYLKKGKVNCDITSGKGGFAVRTDVGLVSVLGTVFSVRVFGGNTGIKRMAVSVTRGAVSVKGIWGEETVMAGESVTLPRLKLNSRPVFESKPVALSDTQTEQKQKNPETPAVKINETAPELSQNKPSPEKTARLESWKKKRHGTIKITLTNLMSAQIVNLKVTPEQAFKEMIRHLRDDEPHPALIRYAKDFGYTMEETRQIFIDIAKKIHLNTLPRKYTRPAEGR